MRYILLSEVIIMPKKDEIDEKALTAYELILERAIISLESSPREDLKGISDVIGDVLDRKNMIEKGYARLRAPEADPEFDMTQPPRETSQLADSMLDRFVNPDYSEESDESEEESENKDSSDDR